MRHRNKKRLAKEERERKRLHRRRKQELERLRNELREQLEQQGLSKVLIDFQVALTYPDDISSSSSEETTSEETNSESSEELTVQSPKQEPTDNTDNEEEIENPVQRELNDTVRYPHSHWWDYITAPQNQKPSLYIRNRSIYRRNFSEQYL